MLNEFLSVAYDAEQRKQASAGLVEDLKKLPNETLAKLASGEEKISFIGHRESGDWLQKYKGTPLFERAAQLEEQMLTLEMQKQQQRETDKLTRDQVWEQRDKVCLQKRLLDLELAKVENSAVTGVPPAEAPAAAGDASAEAAPQPTDVPADAGAPAEAPPPPADATAPAAGGEKAAAAKRSKVGPETIGGEEKNQGAGQLGAYSPDPMNNVWGEEAKAAMVKAASSTEFEKLGKKKVAISAEKITKTILEAGGKVPKERLAKHIAKLRGFHARAFGTPTTTTANLKRGLRIQEGVIEAGKKTSAVSLLQDTGDAAGRVLARMQKESHSPKGEVGSLIKKASVHGFNSLTELEKQAVRQLLKSVAEGVKGLRGGGATKRMTQAYAGKGPKVPKIEAARPALDAPLAPATVSAEKSLGIIPGAAKAAPPAPTIRPGGAPTVAPPAAAAPAPALAVTPGAAKGVVPPHPAPPRPAAAVPPGAAGPLPPAPTTPLPQFPAGGGAPPGGGVMGAIGRMTPAQKLLATGAAAGTGGLVLGKAASAQVIPLFKTQTELGLEKEALHPALTAVGKGIKGIGSFLGKGGKSVASAYKGGGLSAAGEAAKTVGRSGFHRASEFARANPGAALGLTAAGAGGAGLALG